MMLFLTDADLISNSNFLARYLAIDAGKYSFCSNDAACDERVEYPFLLSKPEIIRPERNWHRYVSEYQ